MKIMNKKVLSLVVLAGMTASLHAEPYVSGQIGIWGTEDSNNPFKNIFDADKVRATGRIAGGYLWDLTPCLKLGLELGVQGYQSIKESEDFFTVEYSRATIDGLAVLDYYPTSKVDLFAKAGAAYLYNEIRISDPGFEFTVDEDKVIPKAMIGVGYNVTERVNLNLSLAHEFDKNDSVIPASSLMAGIKYSF